MTLTPEQKAKQRAYHREWEKRNPEKWKEYHKKSVEKALRARLQEFTFISPENYDAFINGGSALHLACLKEGLERKQDVLEYF